MFVTAHSVCASVSVIEQDSANPVLDDAAVLGGGIRVLYKDHASTIRSATSHNRDAVLRSVVAATASVKAVAQSVVRNSALSATLSTPAAVLRLCQVCLL